MSVGGATWDTAGTLELGSGNTFDQADADAFDDPDFAFTDEGWFVYTPTAHQEVRIRTGDVDHTGFIVFSGPDESHKTIMPSLGYDGTGDIYWFLAGETYHLAVGNLSFLTDQTYQIIVDAYTALATTPWYSDLRDRTDNVLQSDTRDGPYGIGTTRSRNSTYATVRAIDSPGLGGLGCAWLHAHYGDSDVIVWEGFCPGNGSGLVDSAEGAGPYADADFSEDDGGNAQDIIAGAAITVHDVYKNVPPQGVLEVPEPLDVGLSFPDWALEWEDDKPDLRSVEVTAYDRPVLDPDDPDYVVPYEVGVTYRNEHDVIPPSKIVPQSFDDETGQYDFWPKGNLSPDFGLDAYSPPEGEEDWILLSEDQNWDEFYEPVGDSAYTRGDWVFGAAMLHSDPDTGPEIERPSFTLAARFGLRAPRYRFVYKPTISPVTRQESRDDGRGLSSGPRLVPASKAGRLVGGYQ